MRGSIPLPSLDALKDQAKRLRAGLSAEGQDITHSKSLELLAAQYGFRDWNTLHAMAGNRPPLNPWMLGSRVKGHYLGQPFEAKILGVQAVTAQPGRYRLTLDLDEFRKRVHCTIDETGRTIEKTSNGRPHVELMW
jgi:hypothetical protein